MSANAPKTSAPPSIITFVICREPSFSSNHVSCSCQGTVGSLKISTPHSSSCLIRSTGAVSLAMISSGAWSMVRTNWLLCEIDASESSTIRVATRGPAGRAVSSGSSRSAVRRPTRIASTCPRILCTSERLAPLEIHWLLPVWVAILPSRVIAHLAITHG